MRIAMFEPEIAGNVGAVLRLGACMGAGVDLIEPLGFAWDDRRVRRAGKAMCNGSCSCARDLRREICRRAKASTYIYLYPYLYLYVNLYLYMGH